MNKVVVGVGAAGFALGFATGATLLYFLGKKKSKEVSEESAVQPEAETVVEQDLEEESRGEAIENYNELVSDLQYRDQHEEDMAADPLTEEEQAILDDYLISKERKEFKERNWGKIEEIPRAEFENFLYQAGGKFEDWEVEDLYFFQDEQAVTDSIGSLLTAERVAQNLGDTLDASGFRNDSREHLYVACYDVETIFDIRKVLQTRDEFFA